MVGNRKQSVPEHSDNKGAACCGNPCNLVCVKGYEACMNGE